MVDAEEETLELFELNEGSRAAVDKARRQVKRHSESARARRAESEGLIDETGQFERNVSAPERL